MNQIFWISLNEAHGDAYNLLRTPNNLVTNSLGENILITLLEWKNIYYCSTLNPSFFSQIMTFQWEQMKWANFQTHYKLSSEKEWKKSETEGERRKNMRQMINIDTGFLSVWFMCICETVFVLYMHALSVPLGVYMDCSLVVCVCVCVFVDSCFLKIFVWCVCVCPCVNYARSVPFFVSVYVCINSAQSQADRQLPSEEPLSVSDWSS